MAQMGRSIHDLYGLAGIADRARIRKQQPGPRRSVRDRAVFCNLPAQEDAQHGGMRNAARDRCPGFRCLPVQEKPAA